MTRRKPHRMGHPRFARDLLELWGDARRAAQLTQATPSKPPSRHPVGRLVLRRPRKTGKFITRYIMRCHIQFQAEPVTKYVFSLYIFYEKCGWRCVTIVF